MVSESKGCLIAHVSTKLFFSPVYGLGVLDEIVGEGPSQVAKEALLWVEARRDFSDLHSSSLSQ